MKGKLDARELRISYPLSTRYLDLVPRHFDVTHVCAKAAQSLQVGALSVNGAQMCKSFVLTCDAPDGRVTLAPVAVA